MFTNKHVIVAMLVTPILAILAWFGTDLIVAERPFEPDPDKSYKLAEKPNCRWPSGVCGLKNGNFEIEITTEGLGGRQLRVTLKSSHPLEGVKFAVFKAAPEAIDRESVPISMYPLDQANHEWELVIEEPRSELTRFHLAIKAYDSLYYGDVGTIFMQPNKESIPFS